MSNLVLLLACIVGCGFSLAQGWPGAVSIDMFQTIHEAKYSRYAGHYDPMAAVLWKLALLAFEMPAAVAAVFFLQVLGYWSMFGLVARHALRAGSPSTALLILALAWSPPFLCYSIAIESNLQVAVWWGCSMAICMTWRRPRSLLLVLPFLWAGFTGRYGTVVAFAPVAFFCVRVTISSWSLWRVGGLALALSAAFQAVSMAVPKWVLGAPSSVSTMSVSQLFDMAGIYRLTGKHSIPPACIPEGHTLDEIVASYEVRNCVPMFWSIGGKPIFTRPKTQAEATVLRDAWWETIKSEPLAYLEVKLTFASAFLLWSYDCVYGVGPDFSGGKHVGVDVPSDPSMHALVRYSGATAYWFVWRGWVWILVATFALVAAALLRATDFALALTAFLAGIAMLIPLIVFGQGVPSRHYVPIFLMFTMSLALALPRISSAVRGRLSASAPTA